MIDVTMACFVIFLVGLLRFRSNFQVLWGEMHQGTCHTDLGRWGVAVPLR